MPTVPYTNASRLRPGTWVRRKKQNRVSLEKSSLDRNYDGRWREVRAYYLNRHPLCEMCEAEGRLTPAEIVHHKQFIRNGGEVRDPDNLMAVCRKCHGEIHRTRDRSFQ